MQVKFKREIGESKLRRARSETQPDLCLGLEQTGVIRVNGSERSGHFFLSVTFSPVGKLYSFLSDNSGALHKIKEYRENEGFCHINTTLHCLRRPH